MTDILGVKFAHYIYLPTEDSETVKDIWSGLTHKFDLSGKTPDELIIGGKALSSSTPIVVANEHMALGLLISKSITAIELLFLHRANQSPEVSLAEARAALSDQISYSIGETTVAVIDGADAFDPSKDPESPLAQPRLYEGDIKGANIGIIRAGTDLEHYYVLDKKDEAKTEEFLLSKLPVIDGFVFKLARQADYFEDQHNFVHDKKRDSDKGLSDILHKWSARSTAENKIDLLEKDVESLSAMYGELVSSLKMVKNAHDIMVKDVYALDGALRELIVNQRDLADFKAAFLGEYEGFIKDLAIDDGLLHRSLDDTRATIEVVRTRIEIERSRESFALQKEGATVQSAASFIELFIVGFYTLEAWEILVSPEVFEHIPLVFRLGADLMFATTVVAFTHYMAKLIQKERSSLGLTLSTIGVLVSIIVIVTVTSLGRAH